MRSTQVQYSSRRMPWVTGVLNGFPCVATAPLRSAHFLHVKESRKLRNFDRPTITSRIWLVVSLPSIASRNPPWEAKRSKREAHAPEKEQRLKRHPHQSNRNRIEPCSSAPNISPSEKIEQSTLIQHAAYCTTVSPFERRTHNLRTDSHGCRKPCLSCPEGQRGERGPRSF